jgi:hypothetical protein
MRKAMDRRFFLKGTGATIMLPFLEAMLAPMTTHASNLSHKRFLMLFAPFGAIMHDDINIYKNDSNWRQFYIPEYTLQPLYRAGLSSYFTQYRGLYNTAAEHSEVLLKRDFPHTIEATGFFTGSHKDNITDSIDQIVSNEMKLTHPLQSLQILAPSHDSDPYFYNGSFKNGRPNARFSNPNDLFTTIFGGHKERILRQSILDSMKDDINKLKRSISNQDNQVLDNYLQGIRDTEKLLDQSQVLNCPIQLQTEMDIFAKQNINLDYHAALPALLKLVSLALQCGITRVVSFHLGGGNDPKLRYNFLSIPGHSKIAIDLHDLTHYRNLNGPDEFFSQFREVNRYHIQQLANLMTDLKLSTDGNGDNLLENTLGIYGGGISQCHFHNYKNIPLILFGQSKKHKTSKATEGCLTYNMDSNIGSSYNDFVYTAIQDRLDLRVERIGTEKNNSLTL